MLTFSFFGTSLTEVKGSRVKVQGLRPSPCTRTLCQDHKLVLAQRDPMPLTWNSGKSPARSADRRYGVGL